MDSGAKINTLKQGLRIKYTGDAPALRTLWETVFNTSTEFVEINGTAFEGGSTSGQLVLERLEYLQAVQDVLAELDPTLVSAPPSSTFADFRTNWLST